MSNVTPRTKTLTVGSPIAGQYHCGTHQDTHQEALVAILKVCFYAVGTAVKVK
jgi:hypothetical protein